MSHMRGRAHSKRRRAIRRERALVREVARAGRSDIEQLDVIARRCGGTVPLCREVERLVKL